MSVADRHAPDERPQGRYLATLALAALGVVYGDIGTSPIYALRESLHGKHGIAPTPENVLGLLSLIVWALVLVISIKYIAFVMRADNCGEGGMIALTALVVPHALLLNLHHNKVIHERLVFLGITTDTRACVADHDRVQVEQLWPNVYRVSAKYGFAEDSDVPIVLDLASRDGIQIDPATSTFFMGREILLATERPGMAIWRERLYARLARDARRATRYFKIPSNRVVELGAEIEL